MIRGWDHQKWADEFQAATARRQGFRELRRDVWESTVEIVDAREYQAGGQRIALDDSGEYEDSWCGTTWYDEADELESARGRTSVLPPIEVRNEDCLLVAGSLIRDGLDVAVLNMANRHNPGGGVSGGAGAQEENLFRRTTAHRSLFRFAEYCGEYGVAPDPEGRTYPLSRRSGAIHSQRITVFRGAEAEGYPLLRSPWQFAMLTMPAIASPPLEEVNGELRLRDDMAEATRIKIRGLLRMAAAHEHQALVLGAWGCGAFCQPPDHVAEIFFEELGGAPFGRVVFAILDDHNSGFEHNPDGNYLPFLRRAEAASPR